MTGATDSLVRYYRTAENWRRYTPEDAERSRALLELYRSHRRYFGERVLDLACGGGVLGAILEGTGRRYLGVDLNPDMILAARAAARERGGGSRFLRADIAGAGIPGRWDSLTLLGNALCHLSTHQMGTLLRHRRVNVHPGTTFLVDYRDVVGMFWSGHWDRRPHVQWRPGRGKITSRTTSVDFEEGVIRITARPSWGTWKTEVTHALWSPFILEPLMRAHGWRRIRREMGTSPPEGEPDPDRWFEVYRYRGRD